MASKILAGPFRYLEGYHVRDCLPKVAVAGRPRNGGPLLRRVFCLVVK